MVRYSKYDEKLLAAANAADVKVCCELLQTARLALLCVCLNESSHSPGH